MNRHLTPIRQVDHDRAKRLPNVEIAELLNSHGYVMKIERSQEGMLAQTQYIEPNGRPSR